MILEIDSPGDLDLNALGQFIQDNESPTAEFIFLSQKDGQPPTNRITFQIHDDAVTLNPITLKQIDPRLDADAAGDFLDSCINQGFQPLGRMFQIYVPNGEMSVIALRENGPIVAPPNGDGFIFTRATVFGLNPDGSIDREDNGVGSPALGSINTRNRELRGAAIPIALAHSLFGGLRNVRGKRIEVTNLGNELSTQVGIVDFGPSTGQVAKNIALDLTFGAHVTDLHGTGLIKVKYRFL
jgi:hypothetical protein